jgi:hypothetical protein
VLAGVFLYTTLTSVITYGLVIESFSIPQGCVMSALDVPKVVQDTSQTEELVTRVKSLYKVSSEKAKRIVNLATVHTMPGQFPSPQLMVAIFKVESNFREQVTSSAGAKGIAQVMPMNSTGRDSFSNAYDSVKLLKEYNTRLNGNLTKTLQAYNAGIGMVLSGKADNLEYAEDVKKELVRLKSS